MSKLNLQRKKFADDWLITGNAYQSAINAGYSENYAKAKSAKLLENDGIKSYIDERLKEIESEKVASQEEVLQYLTSVMRGETSEEVLINRGSEVGQDITDIEVSAKDRIKAAELLGKRYGTWTDKIDIEGDVNIVLEDDYGD